MSTKTSKSEPPTMILLVFPIWGPVSLYAAFHAAAFLWLIQLYGFSRVFAEHLHFIGMPKGGAWIVSNGDHITSGYFLHHFVVMLALWLTLFLVPVAFIYRRRERYAA